MPDTTQEQYPTLLAGRYRLEAILGSGGMSTVHRAYDTVLRRPVAIKLLRPLTGDSAIIAREQREIRTLASLNHHSLVTLYDADIAVLDGAKTTFLVMELVNGPTLAARLRQGPVASFEVTEWVRDLLEALLFIHSSGVIHRDMKPGNILLAPSLLPGRNFTAKLADFGIASLFSATRITSTGTIVGTAAYLSPEQALGTDVGPASDIYSLGLVILEMLTGSAPFTGTMVETLSARLHRNPVIPDIIGPLWSSVLTAMTQRDPDARPTALELISQLSPVRTEATAQIVGETLDSAPVSIDTPTVLLLTPQTPEERRKRSRRSRFGALLIGVLTAVIIAILVSAQLTTAPVPSATLPATFPPGTAAPSTSAVPINSVSPSPLPPVPTPAAAHSGKVSGHDQGNGNGKSGKD